MRELFVLLAHLVTTLIKLCGHGGLHAVVAESLAVKHQLQVINRTRRRAPRLTPWDRLIFGLCAAWIPLKRLAKCAVILKPSSFMRFHQALVRCKYRWLYSSRKRGRPGPKGPTKEVIAAVVEMKRRSPRLGCRKIAEQISHAFGIEIDKDVVRRILAKHYHPDSSGEGASWLTAIGHAKDSLWSIDLFRCESILLQSYWVMVVIDVFTRRIIGFGVARGDIDGVAVCWMFNHALVKHPLPKYVSTDNDPLFRFHRWWANLRILGIDEIKSVPFVPQSHPFVERLIGTLRREYLDHLFFWNGPDLEQKLLAYRDYYNQHRCHTGLSGETPNGYGTAKASSSATIESYEWLSHCHGMFYLPAAG